MKAASGLRRQAVLAPTHIQSTTRSLSTTLSGARVARVGNSRDVPVTRHFPTRVSVRKYGTPPEVSAARTHEGDAAEELEMESARMEGADAEVRASISILIMG